MKRTDRFTLDKVVNVSQKAINNLIKIVKKCGENLYACSETQIQHEICSVLNGERHYTLLEYPYRYLKKKEPGYADILIWGKDENERRTGHGVWIEVKFNSTEDTKLYRQLWVKDFTRLRQVKNAPWDARHSRYWVWLHVVHNTLHDKIVKRFDKESSWISEYPNYKNLNYDDLKELANILQKISNRHKALPNALNELASECKEVSWSLIPYIKNRNKGLSVVLIVAKPKFRRKRRRKRGA